MPETNETTPARPTGDAGKAAPDTTKAPVTETKDQGASTVLGALGKDGQEGTTEKAKGEEGAKPDKPAPADIEVKMPEGLTMAEPVLAGFKALAKEAGLDGPKAQKLLDFAGRIAKEAAADEEKAGEELLAKTNSDWTAELKADKEFGGAKWDETMANAKRALAKFSDPGLTEFLERTALGSHPSLVKTFARIGKAIAEDTVAGATGAPPKDDRLEALKKQYSKSPELFAKKA